MTAIPAPSAPPRALSRPELIAMVAALMAINALSMDIMLPALPEIGRSYAIASENDRQLVLVTYIIASGIAQVFYGPLADALGRRRVLMGALSLYLVGASLCLLAPTFGLFLAARAVQGLAAAATRVVATALVRDLVAGPRMAQIMSSAMTIFMIVPILAPGAGQLILLAGPWRWIFALLLFAGVSLFVWSWFRVPETLPPERRIPLSFAGALAAYREVLSTRETIGYTIALSLTFGAIFSFLTSSQQVFVEIFKMGALFPLGFSSIAVALSAAQFTNSRLVMHVGMRRLAHIAIAGFTALALIHTLHAALFRESLFVFLALLLPTMFLFAFTGPNFNAIAMEPMGHVAGAASAFMGFISTVTGATIGAIIGHLYDGTIMPLVAGQAVLGLCALSVIAVVERGKLFPRANPVDPLR
jgi:DHA1 family bicyclomycin/chloramphenicol resistance-like MFS transporter